MQIILKQDIENLGYKNDVVSVKPGYARNYLIPKGYAIVATDSSIKVLNETLKQQSHKAEKVLAEAKSDAEKIAGTTFQVTAKVGESGKIFGSINTVMLADAMKAKGFNVERRNIHLADDNIKTTGTYTATVTLHKEVKTDFQFEVVGE